VCYPDSVLFHVRLSGVSDQQAEVLADTPGFTCRLDEDGDCLVRVQFAHDVPSHPDVDALERRLRLALLAMAPDAEITDVRSGPRFTREPSSPAVEALHRLRRDSRRVSRVEDLDHDDLVEMLTVFAREFSALDEWLCNGGSVPTEWARRHPGGDRRAAEQIADQAAADGAPSDALGAPVVALAS
jgi:hypothetical protein